MADPPRKRTTTTTTRKSNEADLDAELAANGANPQTFSGGYVDPANKPLLLTRGRPENQRARQKARRMSSPEERRAVDKIGRATKPTEVTQDEAYDEIFQADTDVVDMQTKLYLGGFYPKGTSPQDIQPGIPDELTQQAWKKAVDRAAAYLEADNRVSVEDILDYYSENPVPQEGGEEAAPFSPVLSNPEDLRAQIEKISAMVAGRPLAPNVIDQLVEEYRASEMSTQRGGYEANLMGGATDQTESVESFAMRKTEDFDETGSEVFSMKKNMDVFFNLLHGAQTGGGR